MYKPASTNQGEKKNPSGRTYLVGMIFCFLPCAMKAAALSLQSERKKKKKKFYKVFNQ